MEAWIALYANANDSIAIIWTTFMTINTAIIGWILTKKSTFKRNHFIIACIGYLTFTLAIYL